MSNIIRIHKMTIRKSEIVQNPRKSFEYYHTLPAEVRMVVVDEMKPIDRCRFSQCSFLSSMEAKRSKNSMHLLELHFFNEDRAQITVRYDKDKKIGFYLQFMDNSGKRIMRCTTIHMKELWRTELSGSTDLVQHVAEYFKNMLQDYQNSIKELTVRNYLEDELNDFDFGFKNLSKLEALEIGRNQSVLPVISKLRKPLKSLVVFGKNNNRELENYEISKISQQICLPYFKLNYEQFIRLSATKVTIHIGELTEEDIYKIIKNWQNQASEGKKVGYRWNLEGSNFNISKLLRLLGENDPYMLEKFMIGMEHGFERRSRAFLSHDDGILSLSAYKDGDGLIFL